MKKDLNAKTEKWWIKKHKDIEQSVWISEEMKCAYRNLIKAAYKDGYKTCLKEQNSLTTKG